MSERLISNDSLRFARITYGLLIFIAILMQNHWLVLIVSLIMLLGAFSINVNIGYQIYFLLLKASLKNRLKLIKKESGELNFVSGMTAALLLVGFLFIYFKKFVNFAWIWLLAVDLLIFLACFAGFCMATFLYVVLKNIFKK